MSVPFEAIAEIFLRGSGNVEGKDLLVNNSIALTSKGSGEIEVSVKADLLNVQLNGSGKIKVSGTAQNVIANTSGSSKFKGKELIAEQAEVNISGSGRTSIFVSNSLTGKIRGSGVILYGGNPSKNNVKIYGSGKVKSI
nr:DUF2807 domain-containing protein [Aequorivita capsosiphonis]